MPRSGADVPDEFNARLVVLSAEHPYSREENSAAELAAREILETRGNSPRHYRNTLVFLAADKARLQDLDEALRKYLAWDSMLAEKEALNLSPHQVRQAETQRTTADGAVIARLPETYQWLLVPEHANPQADITLKAIRLMGSETLAVRASRKLKNDELLVTALGATILRKYLDDIPLWRGNHVLVQQLIEDFARYLYLPRLKAPSVLVEAVRSGVGLLTWEKDSFAYAESYDEEAGRFRGLQGGRQVRMDEENPMGLLVKPEVAQRQLTAETPATPGGTGETGQPPTGGGVGTQPGPGTKPEEKKPVPPAAPKRFHGTAVLDPARVGRDASRIADEVIAHLAGLLGSKVTVTLEIEAEVPTGTPENVVRTVTENCRTLKFSSHGFEKE